MDDEATEESRHALVGYLAHLNGADTVAAFQFSGLGTLMAILAIAAGALIAPGR